MSLWATPKKIGDAERHECPRNDEKHGNHTRLLIGNRSRFCSPVIFIVGATAVSVWVKEWLPYVFWINLLMRSSSLGPYHLFRLHDLSLPVAF